MAHGQPDFGAYAEKKTVYALSDMAELAARLGSIVTHDRRGDVIWMDDFESNINKWNRVLLGFGAAVALSAEAARNGALSAKLTTGALAGNTAGIGTRMPYPALSKIGFEISFVINDDLAVLEHDLVLYDGQRQYFGQVLYRPPTDDVTYRDFNGVQQVLASNIRLDPSIYCFHTIKLVVDFVTKKYVRLILNETTYDMSAYGLQSVLSGLAPHLFVSVLCDSAVNGNIVNYVDDAIVTQNEP